MEAFSKWILVAGTGRHELEERVNLAARGVGRAVANRQYGLAVGAWPGVDYVAAEEFARVMKRLDRAISAHLVQIVPKGQRQDFQGGHVVDAPPGARAWTESLRYCHAAILVGGEGGTYETYRRARNERKPVIPLPTTGGDAARIHSEMLDSWHLDPLKGVNRAAFERLSAFEASDPEAADRLARHALDIAETSIHAMDDPIPRVFISYSHEDRVWADLLVGQLRAQDAADKVRVWYDRDIEPGKRWQDLISGALALAKAVVFLVSPRFLRSQFILTHELEQTLQSNAGALQWVLVSDCEVPSAILAFQALHDPRQPLDTLEPAARQDVLGALAQKIVERAQKH